MSAQRSSLIAFAVAVLGVGCLSAMDGAVKMLSLEVGVFAALCWRLGASVLVGGGIYAIGRKRAPSRKAMKLHLMRGVLVVPMAYLFFFGLARVPMAQAIALAFLAPLFALYLAAILLKEKVARASIGGSLLAFAGTLVIFAGQAQADVGREAWLGSFAILGSAMMYAFNIILIRQQSQAADPAEVAFFSHLFPAIIFWLIAILFVGVPDFPQGLDLVIWASAITGIFGAIGLAWAYARADAGYLAATEYSGFLWAAMFGFILFAEIPSPWTVAGAVAIVAGCWIAARPDPPGHEMIEA
ncbi:DMT family transporter [Sphingomicrobium sediminis]|uniref:DMT family transporter n=1 Tax=Sphingomicrobium sediminis TaxID=2950949 RepID=A0A9X2EIK5_9SPHN|nr:DMT family transporter [Sphingomicrobium sediminis]MCM8558185.1 DMT family transporter [Sphingomicrobium sediminis]